MNGILIILSFSEFSENSECHCKNQFEKNSTILLLNYFQETLDNVGLP